MLRGNVDCQQIDDQAHSVSRDGHIVSIRLLRRRPQSHGRRRMDRIGRRGVEQSASLCGLCARLCPEHLCEHAGLIRHQRRNGHRGRSTLPIAVAGVDSLVRGHAPPNRQAWCAFTLIVGGAVGYAWNDLCADLPPSSHLWIALWWFLLVFQLSYGNALIRNVPFDSTWSPVLYNNLLSIPLSLLLAIGSEERVEIHDIKPRAWVWWMLSCVVGTLISFAGFWSQRVVSATCYTVLGVTNKILAVLLNQFMWKHHASARGTMMLLVCLSGGAFYRPSPMRRTTVSAEEMSQLRETIQEEGRK